MWMWVEFSDYNSSQFEFVQYVPRFFSGKHILAPFASILVRLFIKYMLHVYYVIYTIYANSNLRFDDF